MKQWIKDRYNKGQDTYRIHFVKNQEIGLLLSCGPDDISKDTNLYDFLFNPKWGFAKGFWDGIETGPADIKTTNPIYLYYLQQMAIAPDPLEYLEQFKEETK